MTGSSRFQVDADQVRRHAGTVGDLAGQLSAVAGALTGGLGDHALGGFAQFLTAGLGDAMTRTAAALGHAASTVDDMGAGLERAAEEYRGTDDDHAGRLEDLR